MKPINYRFSRELLLEIALLNMQEESLMFWDDVKLDVGRPKEVVELVKNHRNLELDELLILLSRATK